MTAKGLIESPSALSVHAPSRIGVAGWVTFSDQSAMSVLILLNGRPAALAPVDGSRPDIAALTGQPQLERSGFSCVVNLAELPVVQGAAEYVSVRIDLIAIGHGGTTTEVLDSVEVLTQGVRGPRLPPEAHLDGAINHPADGDIVANEEIEIAGWVTWDRRQALSAIVQADGVVVGAGSANVARPDVAEYFDQPAWEFSGFSVRFDPSEYGYEAGDKVSVAVFIVGATNRDLLNVDIALLGELTIELADDLLVAELDGVGTPRRIEGLLDAPVSGAILARDLVFAYGWALSEEASIDEVQFIINGTLQGNARLGMPRQDIRGIRDVPEASICGFEYFLELGDLPSTDVELDLEIRVSDLNGNQETLLRRTYELEPAQKTLSPLAVAQKQQQEERVRQLRETFAERVTNGRQQTNRPFNLLVFTHELGLGGGQLWLHELLKHAGAGRDFPCTVVAQKGGVLQEELERLGINVHTTSWFPHYDVDAFEGRLFELAKLIDHWGITAVLANSIMAFAAGDIADRLGLPCLWAIHESYRPSHFWSVNYGPGTVDPLIQSHIDEVMARIEPFVFEAQATREQYAEVVPLEHSAVIPYGIDLDEIAAYCSSVSHFEARQQLGLPQGTRIVLVMGTTEPRKSQPMIAAVFATIAAEYPDVRLVFVGDTRTPYSQGLKLFIEECGGCDQIVVEPVTKDTYLWYRASDVLLSASDIESLPRTFLEAMAFGLPIAATAVFGVPELIEDGHTGLLFEPRSVSATVAVLRRVLDADASVLASIAGAAFELVRTEHDSSAYSARIIKMLKDKAAQSEV